MKKQCSCSNMKFDKRFGLVDCFVGVNNAEKWQCFSKTGLCPLEIRNQFHDVFNNELINLASSNPEMSDAADYQAFKTSEDINSQQFKDARDIKLFDLALEDEEMRDMAYDCAFKALKRIYGAENIKSVKDLMHLA